MVSMYGLLWTKTIHEVERFEEEEAKQHNNQTKFPATGIIDYQTTHQIETGKVMKQYL